MSVRGSGAHKVKVTGERAKDHRALQMGPWVAGRLLLFDLGYFRYQLFDCIDRNGGYFISRLSANANPRIVAVHRRWRGDAIDLEGKRLKEVTGRLQQDVLDVEVEVTFQRRVYAGTRRTVRRRLRLVAVRLPESTEYRFYLTNIDPDSLDAQAVAQTYAARWQIELSLQGAEVSLSPRRLAHEQGAYRRDSSAWRRHHSARQPPVAPRRT